MKNNWCRCSRVLYFLQHWT